MTTTSFLAMCFIVMFLCALSVSAQTTTFSHQGKLTVSGAPANGNFDFEFKLFDAVSGGAQQGATVQRLNVAVANGIYAVSLDFGSAALPGADRFLDIAVRTAGDGAFTPLAPRQRITSAPYAIQALNAATANTVAVSGVPAGNGNYVQNTTTTQAGSNFNISGTGKAAVFDAATQYNINGQRTLFATSFSTNQVTFVGVDAGSSFVSGISNTFVGRAAGQIFQVGSGNTFVGNFSGFSSVNGNENSAFGVAANVNNGLSNATAIGYRTLVTQSNSLVLGSINGVNSATADTNVGIGTTAPGYRLDVVGRSRFRQNPGQTGGTNSAGFWFFQNTPNADQAFVGMETDNSVGFYGNNGGNWGLVMNTQTGVTTINALGTVGGIQLCRNLSNQISNCSSSLRYKTNISQYSLGMLFVNKLRPISFDWKDGGMKDVGFGAEDVEKIDQRFVTYNSKGEVEGVKYDRLSVAFVNAFKEQQAQIETLQKQIDEQKELITQQRSEIDGLKQLVCSQNPMAKICLVKEKKR